MAACSFDSGIEEAEEAEPGKLYAPWDTNYVLEAHGGEIKVPVVCSGAWRATTDDEWVTILNSAGIGNDSVQLRIKSNAMPDDRTARVTISLVQDAAKRYEVTIQQEKSGNLLAYTGYERSAGFGYDVTRDYCKGTTYAIFNIDRLEYLQTGTSQYFVRDDYSPYAEDEYAQGATLTSVSTQLSASASIDLDAVVAKAEVKGTVNIGEVEEHNSMYAVKRTKRIVYVRDIQYNNIMQYFIDTNDSTVFSPGFYADWKKLSSYNTNNKPIPTSEIDEFLNKWGVGIVVRSFMGGCIDYSMAVDRSVLSESTTIDIALDAEIAGGILDAELNANMKNVREAIKNRFNLDITIKGGDVQSVSPLVFGESIKMLALQEWMNSISYSASDAMLNNAAVVDIKVASVANLFSGRVKEKIRNVIETRNNR